MPSPYEILDRKRRGEALASSEVAEVARGAVDGSWSDAQLAAFLMAAAIHDLDERETGALTRAMLESGERWDLASVLDPVGDKHSTGGVGDKVSLLVAPLLASCGLPIAMLTGRGLGHTGGTADKLEGIPGLDLTLDRGRMLELLEDFGLAIGTATERIAPADRRLYALRDATGTVASVPLIAASILSKKLALGASGVVYDVKTGSGAFLSDFESARRLADLLVRTSVALGTKAAALVTDMSQPLGRWVGHNAEVNESLECLRGAGPADLRQLTIELGATLAGLLGVELDAARLGSALDAGQAYETFLGWARGQGADPAWLARPELPLAPVETILEAPVAGCLQAVDARELGLALAAAGGGRRRAGEALDHTVALRGARRVGESVAAGEELARVYWRTPDQRLAARMLAGFTIGPGDAAPPPLILDRVSPPGGEGPAG